LIVFIGEPRLNLLVVLVISSDLVSLTFADFNASVHGMDDVDGGGIFEVVVIESATLIHVRLINEVPVALTRVSFGLDIVSKCSALGKWVILLL